MFSIEARNQRISPAIAIKSPAMNFPSKGLMLQNKSSCLFYFNSVSLSFAGMYSWSEHGIIFLFLFLYNHDNSGIENKS